MLIQQFYYRENGVKTHVCGMPAKAKERARGVEKSPSVWARALKPRQQWDNKDEFLDVIYWLRQVLSLVLGLIWGLIPLQGYVGLLLFLAVNAGVIYLYFALYQRVEEEEFGGTWELLKEGFLTSFALFLVNWIIIFTALHHDRH